MYGRGLMDQIYGYRNWRPSRESVYPLLAQLLKERLIEPYPDEEPGMKHFKLAEGRVSLLKEPGHHDEQIMKRHRTTHKIYWILRREMPEALYESLLALMNAVEKTNKKRAVV